MTAVTAAASAAGTVTVNPYWVGWHGWPWHGWPGGGPGRNVETEETVAEVIVTGLPIGR
jgi:hypothetical protein